MSQCSISGDHFADADYADDIATVEDDPGDIVRALERIEAASSKLDLHISWPKIKN